MRRLGLKLWSTDIAYSADAGVLVESGAYDYIELFSVPGSLPRTLDSWRSLRAEFVIHAPHSMKGLNFASKDSEKQNKKLADEAFAFADGLDAKSVVFHPGVDGPIEETIRQMLLLADPRTVVENKPMIGLKGEACVGWSPDQIARILRTVGCGFCLDFGHAVSAANGAHTDRLEVLKGLLRLRPLLYHLTDGLLDGLVDAHVRYGHGTYPLRSFLSMIPKEARITNEGARSEGAGLVEAREDSIFFRALELPPGRYDGLEMRHASSADVDELRRLSNDSGRKLLCFSGDEISDLQQGNSGTRTSEDPYVLRLVFRHEATFVGHISLQTSVEVAKASTVTMYVEATYRDSEYCRTMLRMSLNLVKGIGKVDEVYARVRKENTRALRHFRALGFVASVPSAPDTAGLIQLRLSWRRYGEHIDRR